MRKIRLNAVASAMVAATLVAGGAHATILTFDVDGITAGLAINQGYGDYVTGLTDGIGSYGEGGEGFTGNVAVDYGTFSPALWTTDFSDLTNVLYEEIDGSGPLQVALTADAGYNVQLYDFELGSWLSNSTVNSIRVTNEHNAVLFESLSETILQNIHTDFSFSSPLVGQSLTITIDQINLGSGSDNVGIDNIRFGQTVSTPVPEPATMTLLGMGLAAIAARSRRRKA